MQNTHSVLKRFVVASLAFVGVIVPLTFAMAVLAAPSARPEAPYLPGCDRNLADAGARVAAMEAQLKASVGMDRLEICKATRLYFLEMVKARAVTALCKNGSDRERALGRFDIDIEHANEAIATRCLSPEMSMPAPRVRAVPYVRTNFE